MDTVSLFLLIFVFIVILICINLDLFKEVDNAKPLIFQYRLRRFFNWFLLAISYASMYIGRYNFTFLSHQKISSEISLSESQYGWILTIGYWFYAFVSPFMGSIGDLVGPKKVVVLGIIGSGLVNCLLGFILIPRKDHEISILKFIPPVVLFSFFNGLNFMLQSLSTGSVNKINSGWYKKSEIGMFGGIFSALLSTSFFFTFNIGDILVESSLPWNYIFIIPGLILILFGVLSLFVVKENPKLAGFGYIDLSSSPTTTTNNNDQITISNSKNNENLINSTIILQTDEMELSDFTTINDKESLTNNQQDHQQQQLKEDEKVQDNTSLLKLFKNMFSEVLKKENLRPITSKENILNGLSLFCIGWVKEGFVGWFQLYLSDRYGDNANETLISVSLAGVSIGSMIGGFLCGLVSDKIFSSKRPPALFIFFFMLNILSILLYFIKSQLPSTCILILVFICIFGSNNVLAVTALLDLGTIRNAALMAGILTMFQYIASGFSGFLLGYIVENFGFDYWLLSMLPFSITAMLMMAWSSNYLQNLYKKLNGIYLHHPLLSNHNLSDDDNIHINNNDNNNNNNENFVELSDEHLI